MLCYFLMLKKLILLSIFTMAAFTEAASYPLKSVYVDTPFPIDDVLQTFAPGNECYSEFIQKEGKLIVLNVNDPNPDRFVILPGDDIRISCSAGWCRSQTAYLIFSMYEGICLLPPHGTRYFFDSIGRDERNRSMKGESGHDEFKECFGFKKALRIGHKEFIHLRNLTTLPPETVAKITAFYNDNYFGPKSKDPSTERIVYITFAANAHAIMYRLNQTNDSLKKHILVCIDSDDYMSNPLPEWNTYPRSMVSYANFAKLLLKFFDFSQLELKKFPNEDPYIKLKKIIF